MAKVFNYLSDSFVELKSNVTWSTWAEVQKYTVVVSIFAIIMALATWGVDTVFGKAIAGFFSLINS